MVPRMPSIPLLRAVAFGSPLFVAPLLLLLIGLNALPSNAHARDADGAFAVRGAGQYPCQILVDNQNQQSNAPYLIAGWIDGYVTGLNRSRDQTFDLLPWQHTEFLLELLLQHCTQFPDRPLSQAIHAMTQAMEATKLTSKSTLETFNTPDGDAQIYRDTLRLLQTKLAERGHYTSTIDGQFGPGTQAAITAFQKEAGLPEIGLPDQLTLWALFQELYNTQ